MKKNQMKVQGIVPPMVTPLKDANTLDEAGTEKLISYQLEAGVGGLFLLGTTGMGPCIGDKMKKDFVSRVCKLAAKQVPVLVGASDTRFEATIRLSEQAAAAGANSIVVAPPYYFMMGQAELIAYYTRLADASALPVFLYNMPPHTKTMLEIDTVVQLTRHPKIVGIKDSSSIISYFNNLLVTVKRERPDFMVFMGPEEALGEAVLSGADGGVSSGANVFPKLFVDLYEAAKARNLDEVISLQRAVLTLDSVLYSTGRYASRYTKGLVCALNLMGICSDSMPEPFDSFGPKERQQIRRHLVKCGLLKTSGSR